MDHDPIQVTRGNPTSEEVAALVTAIAQKSREAQSSDTSTERPSTWAAYWRSVRTPLRPGPDAWRISGLPYG